MSIIVYNIIFSHQFANGDTFSGICVGGKLLDSEARIEFKNGDVYEGINNIALSACP